MIHCVMPINLYERYKLAPEATDADVRRICNIPEDRYYSVTFFPPKLVGGITLTGKREVKAVKISKSP